MLSPPEETELRAWQRQCNWLQALDGDIDTSHFSFLHTGKIGAEDIDPNHRHRQSRAAAAAPRPLHADLAEHRRLVRPLAADRQPGQ
jgi:phenylpropionate dioxygenase-like ring-hydroxylating dioxygenase large terminal subunit